MHSLYGTFSHIELFVPWLPHRLMLETHTTVLSTALPQTNHDKDYFELHCGFVSAWILRFNFAVASSHGLRTQERLL